MLMASSACRGSAFLAARGHWRAIWSKADLAMTFAGLVDALRAPGFNTADSRHQYARCRGLPERTDWRRRERTDDFRYLGRRAGASRISTLLAGLHCARDCAVASIPRRLTDSGDWVYQRRRPLA